MTALDVKYVSKGDFVTKGFYILC